MMVSRTRLMADVASQFSLTLMKVTPTASINGTIGTAPPEGFKSVSPLEYNTSVVVRGFVANAGDEGPGPRS